MLHRNTAHTRNHTAISPQPLRTDVVERTLSFNRTTGLFTLSSPAGPVTQNCTGAFHIALTAPQTIIIHAEGIVFMPFPESPSPLPFKTSGSLQILSDQLFSNDTQITIDVTHLPSRRGVLGFLLYVRLPQESHTVQGIQTPPFFVTQGESSMEQELQLTYDRHTGDFTLTEAGSTTHLPITIKVEKGMVVPRVGDGSNANNSTLRNIRVHLVSEPGVVFADTPAVFTLESGPTVNRISDTEIVVTRDFTSGTGFGVSFGVQVPIGLNETCTVYSPDPIIIDKQIGTGGEG